MADLLGELVQTIVTLKERIKEHGTRIGAYESRTRVALIDPMLCALGWDVPDPHIVQIEPRTDNGWADYALLGSNRRVALYVEAKKYGEDIARHTQQTVGYAIAENMRNNTNIRYCALTNGDKWEVYDLSPPQRSVMNVSIAEDDPAKAALQFIGLWRRSLADGSFDQAVEPIVEVGVEAAPKSITQDQVATRSQPTSLLASSTPMTSSTIGEAGWVPLSGEYPTTGHPPPSAIKLPGEEPIDIKSWVRVPMEVALWLHRKSLLTHENCRFRVTKKRYLFSPDGKHATGTAFHSPRGVGNTGIQMEASFNPDSLIAYTCALLQNFAQDTSQVHLKLRRPADERRADCFRFPRSRYKPVRADSSVASRGQAGRGRIIRRPCPGIG